MATLTAYRNINMDGGHFVSGTMTIATATHIQVKHGTDTQNYYGSFTYDSAHHLTGGIMTSTDLSDDVGKVFSLTGGHYNMLTINNYIVQSDVTGLKQYLFAGNDLINGSAQADVLNSYAGNDTINGYAGNDILRGGTGNDVLNGGSGGDNMVGGDGSDLYFVDNALDIVTETNAIASTGGIDIVFSYLANYTLKANVENAKIVPTSPANLTGNGLNNLIYAGAGINHIDGAAGSDTVSYAFATTTGISGVTLNLSVVNSSGQSTAGGISGADLVKNIENIVGSNYADTLVGNSGNNTLNGGVGNDLILGLQGNDILMGGAGKDNFRFNTALNSLTNKDTITDFSSVDDTIQLENAVFSKLANVGTLAAAYFHASATGTAADSNDFVLYSTASGIVSYDADGNGAGAAVQIATIGVSSHPALTNADFVVI